MQRSSSLQLWLQTLAIGFTIASIGIVLAIFLYFVTVKKTSPVIERSLPSPEATR